MKNLLFPFVTPIIFSVIFSVTLTACGGGSAGGSASNLDSNFTPSNDFTLNPLGTIEEFAAKDIDIPTYKDGENDVAYTSLTKIATDATTDNPIDVILHGLAVMKNDNTAFERDNTNIDWKDQANDAELKINREITLLRVTAAEKSPAVKLTFGADGAISGVTIYGDQEYTNATADRSNIFDFTSNYMVYISWNLAKDRGSLSNTTEDNIYNIDGIMLAGIQTADGNIPTSGSAEFTGKGKGVYGSETENYNTIFDVTANVNFAGRSLSLNIGGTKCTGDNCSDITDQNIWDGLNFNLAGASALRFTNEADDGAVNAIGADITLGNGLAGKLDARFYGNAGDGANELGGTFAFVNAINKNYYYGAFGAKRGDIELFDNTKSTAVNSVNEIVAATPQPDNITTSGSLTTIKDTDATLQGLAVFANNKADYSRETDEVLWSSTDDIRINRTINISQINNPLAAVTLTFAGSDASVKTAYVNETYQAGDATFTVDRRDIFGFDSAYMAYISWRSQKTELELGNGTDDSLYDISGMMLAGIQTANDSIFKQYKVKFTGAGKGVYGNVENDIVTNVDTVFNVTATVDFTARDVKFSFNNTCKTAACADKSEDRLTILDFDTTKIKFAADADADPTNNISGDVTLGNGLAGRLDARFYGGKAEELGGTFATVAETDKRYYYGVFGTSRNGVTPVDFIHGENTDLNALGMLVVENPPAINIPEDTDNVAYNSLTAISDAADAGADDATLDVTLHGLALFIDDTTDYERATTDTAWADLDTAENLNTDRQITLLRSDSPLPAVKLTFDDEGKISAVTVYADENHTATLEMPESKNDFVKSNADGLTITADRNTIFGFDSNYMAYISWSLERVKAQLGNGKTDSIYNKNGIMLAGIQTAGGDIPTSDTASFDGAGAGVYGILDADDVLTRYNTIFTTNAIVDFSARTIAFTTTGTACTVDDSALCTENNIDATILNSLNFNLTGDSVLNYASASNKITADVTLDNSLTGKLDARFYGGAAWEFGGTFALTELNQRYYYGAFGAKRDAINYGQAYDITGITTPINVTHSPAITDSETYASIEAVRADADADNDDKTITMNALGVYGDIRTDYARSPNITSLADGDNAPSNSLARLSGAATKLDFDADGNISAVTLYLNDGSADKTYTATIGTPSSANNITDETISAGAPDGSTATLNLKWGNADTTIFGFDSNNIAYLSWHLTHSADNTKLSDTDYDIAGMMLAGVQTSDKNIFATGKTLFTGAGRGYVTLSDATRKGVTFTITANVDFSKKEVSLTSTASMECDTDFSSNCSGDDTYNFKTAGAIDYTGNSISVSNSDDDADGFKGEAEVGFYGAGTNEFAGAFAMSNADNDQYYGIFGTQRDYVISEKTVETTHADTPTTFTALPSFADETRKNTNMLDNALKLASFVQLTRDSVAQTITNNKISNAVVVFSYDTDGDFTADATNPLKFYFADRNIEIDGGSGGADSFADATFILSKKTDDLGFTANYLISIEYKETNNYGYGIAGFETVGTDIIASGSATFTGKGRGRYSDDDADNDISTVFDITADVDFGNYTVTLASENTCTDSSDCTGTPRTDLNFKGDLTYAANTNQLNFTNVKTAGTDGDYGVADTDNTELLGTAYAKFYGPNSSEFGGTFSLQNANSLAGYIGFFAGERGNITETIFDNTAITTPIPVLLDDAVNTAIATDKTNQTMFANAASDGDIITMNALVGYGDITNIYKRSLESQSWDPDINDTKQTNTIARYSNAAASIGFDSATNTINQVKLYLTDNATTYTANFVVTDTNNATLTSSAVILDADKGDANTAKIWVYRGSNVFGFDPKYMAQIRWELDKPLNAAASGLSQTFYDRNGIMLVGIETNDLSVISKRPVTFAGKGRGYVNLSDGSRNGITFNITAEIDFTTTTASLSTNTSKKCTNGFGSCNTNTAYNFKTTTAINFGTNNSISGAVINVANDDDGFKGTLDARFYGPEAREFGGAFAMSDADNNQYYGVFGGLNDIYEYEKIFADPVETSAADLPSATNTDVNNFNTAFNTSTKENFTGLKAFGVERFVEHIHTRDASEIGTDWAAADVTAQTEPYTARIRRSEDARFDVTIGTGMENPTLYFAENKLIGGGNSVPGGGRLYSGDIGNGELDANNLPSEHNYSGSFFNNIFDIGGQLNNTATQPSFLSKYMIFIRWKGLRSYSANLSNPSNKRLDKNATEDRTYEVVALAMAGFETAYTNIPKSGTAVFSGNSYGQYRADAEYGYGNRIQSDIRVNIDFAERTAQFTSSNACSTCDGINKNLAEYAHLNFTTQKTRYDDAYSGTAGKNQILANATTQGDDDNPAMNGMLEARFYGTGTGNEAVKELGGTFAFQGDGDHSGRTYVGHFGTKR